MVHGGRKTKNVNKDNFTLKLVTSYAGMKFKIGE